MHYLLLFYVTCIFYQNWKTRPYFTMLDTKTKWVSLRITSNVLLIGLFQIIKFKPRIKCFFLLSGPDIVSLTTSLFPFLILLFFAAGIQNMMAVRFREWFNKKIWSVSVHLFIQSKHFSLAMVWTHLTFYPLQ